MVADSDLVNRLREILGSSDLNTATPGSVRRQLEEEFKLDLSDRKTFIRDQIDFYLQTLEENNEQSADGNVEEENDPVEDEEAEDSEIEKERSNNGDKEVKKRGGGFNKLCSLSPQLQKLLGVSELARPQVVKKIWEYIRENKLQDPNNKRKILCDESLQALFRVKSIDMFQMNKSLSKHIWPLAADNENAKQKTEDEDGHDSVLEDNKLKEEEDDEEDAEEEEEEEKKESNEQGSKKKGSNKVDKYVKKRGGFTKLCSLSPELQTFVGVSELARTEVVKKLWTYIKENKLQDPANKRNIICDESLRALFHVNCIDMFQMNKAISKHIRPLDKEDDPANSTRKEKRCKEVEEGADEAHQREKRPKKEGSK